jgi:flagellar basal body-associated protein FliL
LFQRTSRFFRNNFRSLTQSTYQKALKLLKMLTAVAFATAIVGLVWWWLLSGKRATEPTAQQQQQQQQPAAAPKAAPSKSAPAAKPLRDLFGALKM